jgi:hypothetical protein
VIRSQGLFLVGEFFGGRSFVWYLLAFFLTSSAWRLVGSFRRRGRR